MNKLSPVFLGVIRNNKLDFTQSEKDKLNLFLDSFNDGQELEIQVSKLSNQRTAAQNRALHKYFELVAQTLNESGLTVEKVIENFTMEHEWSAGAVKELLWREAQRFALQKESTTELEKRGEIDAVWEVLNRFLAKLKVESISFPSAENIQLNEKI